MSNFQNFLARNSVQLAKPLPLIHSTKAQHLRPIMSSGTLRASGCDVFKGESLNYFFMGRPAFKEQDDGRTAEYWQLPCCFIFEYQAIHPIKRIFPFDSGAFDGGRYPSYINDLPMADYESSDVPNAPERIIGAFFGDPLSYMALQAKDKITFERDFTLNSLDFDIRALHKLALEPGGQDFDDRRLTIEIQTEGHIDLKVTKPLAVIAPNVFFQDQVVRRYIQEELGAQPIGYSMHPLSVSKYYSSIYESVAAFYKSAGIL